MRGFARCLRHVLNGRAFLYLLEQLVLVCDYHSDKPQLFILGLPRTGTTLVYQYIVHRLHVAYFTNGVGRYFQSPCLTTFFQHRLHGDYRSDFKSSYGKVIGPVAPREAGSFWGRFFGIEDYIRYEDVMTKDVKTLRNTIACVQKIFGDAPFVNKNVKHMLRIDAISKIFPNSYFLVVERDLKDVALSVLRGRYKNLPDPKEWWSVKPPNYQGLKDLPLAEQAAQQLSALREKMESDFSHIPSSKVARVGYKQFCQEPETLIRTLQAVFGDIPYRNDPVSSFDIVTNEPETAEEKQLMELTNNVSG